MQKISKRLEQIREQLYTKNEYGVEHQSTSAKLSESDQEFLNKAYGLNTNLHRMCVNCQARQLIKYHGQKTDELKANEFHVRCEGVPKRIPMSRSLLENVMRTKNMTKERAMLWIKSTKDPVAWCSIMFGFNDASEKWRLRPYQKEQLRCNALRMVIREGRRSGKTFIVALKMLYLIFNKVYSKGRNSEGHEILAGPEIMIVTPYQSQISNIFNEMEKILKRNEELTKQCTTGTAGSLYVKTPFFRMEFSNGAKVSGFVSGVGTKVDGSGGGTMRGQNANIIYLDEMDMIPDEVLDKVVIPILATTDDVMMIATSTPIGKRARFYKWCKERLDFKEDYFPSTVLPQWDIIKAEVEAENSEDGFRAEYMAEFIDGAYGVFKPTYIYAARQDYAYEDCERLTWWHKFAGVRETTELIKVIGIDWNKNAGSEYVVVAYDPNKHWWFVIESVNISASQFSSVKWKEEVVRLNYKHKPHYIYADEGYGHTIIEDLKLMAHAIGIKKNKSRRDLETAKLVERLVAFNFSQRVELTSPIDGTPIVKTGKEYLVENAVRIFEDQRIWYPEEDDTIRTQLQNYVVLRRSPTTKKPVYGPENELVGDHRLDALMLALGGLSLENSVYSRKSTPIGKPIYLSNDTLKKRTIAKQGLSALEALQAKSIDPDKFGRRKFRLEQSEFLRAVSDRHPSKQPRTPRRRSDRNKPKEGGILSEMLQRASDFRGYGNDTEHLYHRPSSAGIVQPRRTQRSGIRHRRR